MSITGFIILLAVIWFITLWCVLPFGLRTQADENERMEGTMSGSPANFRPARAFKITTFIAVIIWAIIVATIASVDLNVLDIDPLGTLETKEK